MTVRLREGRLQTVAAFGAAGATAGIIVAASWTQTELAGRLAISGVALFVVALVFGSPRLVGLATVPVLAGALVASAAAAEPTWTRSIVLGCLWYIASELAWNAIERRDAIERSRAINTRQTYEVATVVMLSLATTTVGFLLSFLAPVRTILAVGLVVLGLLAALRWATRHIGEPSVVHIEASD